MEKMILTATQAVRSDKFISENVEGITRSFVKKLFDEGLISVNGKEAKPSAKLKAGDIIEVKLPEPKETEAVPQDIPLDIVYEDSDVLIVNKPRGMVVHPAAGNEDGTLVNAVMFHCGDSLSAIGGVLRPGIVHRIDKDTTGLLAVAKNNAAHLALSDQLKDRSLSRTYFALVHGNIKEDSGTIDAPIARSESDRKKMSVTKKDGREAVTDFEVLERFGAYTLVKCKLRTGRTHQ
ncbi:MAG: RluA family pseudouridine synthase, partial [Clostridia bacterium]